MEKIFTERAHLMCPHMQFGIAVSIDAPFDIERIKETFNTLSENHPFLRAVIGHDETDNSYYYDVTDCSKISLTVNEDALTALDSPELIAEYERLIGYDWDVTEEGLLKAAAWPVQGMTAVLLVFHHLLADGRGALDLAEEVAGIYTGNASPAPVTEKLISSPHDFPAGSELPFISRLLVERANKNWAKEGNEALSYQRYHEYADSFTKNDKVSISVSETGEEDVSRMAEECREHSVTVNDYLMAKMFREEGTDKVIIAKDLRDSLKCYNAGALGNYSTAFSIELKKKPEDTWKIAQEVHKKVRRTLSDPKALYLVLQCYASLTPEILDASFMAATGGFDSKSAAFIGKMFFGFDSPKGYSITNLGKTENRSICDAFFIPPASPAIRKTAGVLTVNGKMTVCISERDLNC